MPCVEYRLLGGVLFGYGKEELPPAIAGSGTDLPPLLWGSVFFMPGGFMLTSIMSRAREDRIEWMRLPQSLQRAKEFCLSEGIVRYGATGEVTNLQCSLLPYECSRSFYEKACAVNRAYTELYHRITVDREFLTETIRPVLGHDDFVTKMYECLPEQIPQKPWVYLNRNDFMPAQVEEKVIPKQVEINLMAAALGVMSERVNRLHRYLYAQDAEFGDIVESRSGVKMATGMADGFKSAFMPGRDQILFVVPKDEQNAFDQRGLEYELVEKHNIEVHRVTLEELGEESVVRSGDLYFREKRVGLVYFRFGYAPPHYASSSCWDARKKAEASSAISVPSISAQLANTKLVQSAIAQEGVLECFVEDASMAKKIRETFVEFGGLDGTVLYKGERLKSLDALHQDPDHWVLKPHREGGDNNFFGQEILAKVESLKPEEYSSYIVMEYIRQKPFEGLRLHDLKAVGSQCFTEIGLYGVATYEGSQVSSEIFNRDADYLVRTKDVAHKEGLVLAGYSFLDSLLLNQP